MLENFNENDYMIQCTGHIVKMFRHSPGHRFQVKIQIILCSPVVCAVFHVAELKIRLDSPCKTVYEINNYEGKFMKVQQSDWLQQFLYILLACH